VVRGIDASVVDDSTFGCLSARAPVGRLRIAFATIFHQEGIPNRLFCRIISGILRRVARAANPPKDFNHTCLSGSALPIVGAFVHAAPPEISQNVQRTIMNAPHLRPRPSFGGRSKRWTSSRPSRPEPQRSQNARRNYEQYLTLAQAEAQNGNTVAAENCYQYAEHYFRSMSSTSEDG
jgi:hypothetical protein